MPRMTAADAAVAQADEEQGPATAQLCAWQEGETGEYRALPFEEPEVPAESRNQGNGL